MDAKARAEVRHISLEGKPYRVMRLTVLVSDYDLDGNRILRGALQEFENFLNQNGTEFRSYVAFTGNISTGQSVHVGGKRRRQGGGALPVHQRASLWAKIKAWVRQG